MTSTVVSSPRYHLIVPLWGEEFTNRFIRFGLPSQLAEGNIPALAKDMVCYQIVTDGKTKKVLQNSSLIQQLNKLVNVEITVISIDYERPWIAMSHAYNHAMKKWRRPDVAHVFLTPDSIWSNKTFQNMAKCVEGGKRAVLICGLRVAEEAIPEIERQYSNNDRSSMNISGKELIEYVLKYPHPITLGHIVENHSNQLPAHYYWQVPGVGYIARCFHLHPLLVWPEKQSAYIRNGPTTLDHEFVKDACDYESIVIVRSAEKICGVDVCKSDHMPGPIQNRRLTWDEQIEWVRLWTNGYHRNYAMQSICLFSKNDSIDTLAYEQEAEDFISRLLDIVKPFVTQQSDRPMLLTTALQDKAYERFAKLSVNSSVRKFYRYLLKPIYRRFDEINKSMHALAINQNLREKEIQDLQKEITLLRKRLSQEKQKNNASG